MTVTQQVFVVFFAIFWGGLFNVTARWKMFNWPLFPHHKPVRRRILLSAVMFNLVPLVYFALCFCLLRQTPANLPTMNFGEAMLWIAAGVIPAFAIFGFYRLWLAIVECCPDAFYMKKADGTEIDPSSDEFLKLDPKWSGANSLVGFGYLGIAGVAVFLAWYFSPVGT